VTYKSFFTLEEALREKEALESNGYDTYLQPVAAYSTLGWLKDPIFSTMLGWDEPTLVNIILHEMVHATIYFKGESDLNEQLATFIGDRGTLLFLTEKYGPESKEVALAMAYQEDDLRFAKWIEEAYAQLMRFYEQPLLREEKLRMREEVFQMIQEKFREMESQLKTDCYRNFGRRKFNNAVLMAHRRYLGRLDRWESLYETMGRDLRKAVEFLKEIKASGDKKALISFLE
jgi:predicted aminopeptidase